MLHLPSIARTALPAVLMAATLAGPAAASGLDVRPANPTCRAPSRGPDPNAGAMLAPGLGGVALASPTAAVQSPLDPDLWYVAELSGRIQRVDAAAGTKTVALDLSSLLYLGGEGGLLGLALHPAFALNGQIYVYSTRQPGAGMTLRSVVSRFTTTNGGVSFSPASEQTVLSVPQYGNVHLGGALHFGPDGRLYLALGDGAFPDVAQSLGDLRGKLLRLDVGSAPPYAIPPDNPFVGVAGARGEIWALGFRNPYRWSFDRTTGALWLADVGQSQWEEIDVVTRGGNYGWPYREGPSCLQSGACTSPSLIDPVIEYSHAEGCAVIGGFVYRGASLPSLAGAYVYGDLCGQNLWRASDAGGGSYEVEDLTDSPETFYGMAQGLDGEMLVLGQSRAYRIVPDPGANPPSDPMPARLSDSGCVDPNDPSRPAAGLVPYDLLQPFWSDGASKERYFALPDGARISVGADGDFALPAGSVTMKQFRLGGKPVETRFLVRHGDGTWGGYSYQWNQAGSEARLLTEAEQRVVSGVTWNYPSPAQCFQCHTSAAGVSLGLESAQLNGDLFYPQTARTANQLTTLSAVGFFTSALPQPIGAQPRLETTSIDQQARAWLHANCANCHRPGGPTPTSMDLRSGTPFSAMGICNVAPAHGNLGVGQARLLRPSDPSLSLLSLRAQLVGPGQMPPLARSLVDGLGTAALDAWIRSMPPGCTIGSDGDDDGIGDGADNCPLHANATQTDSDGDGIGNACETACRDGVDNDGDGRQDYPLDGGCRDVLGTTERPACNDGLDNDGDGKIDGLDIGCAGTAGSAERPLCSDGLDNDGDGTVDWNGPGASDPDPQCAGLPSGAAEQAGCGLGVELPALFAALAGLRHRRQRARSAG